MSSCASTLYVDGLQMHYIHWNNLLKMARPGQTIPPVTLYSTRSEIKSAFDEASKSWLCRTCGAEFNLLESMGNLECWQHPGYIQSDGRWSCCGKLLYPLRWLPCRDIQQMYTGNCVQHPAKVKGCQRCDHNTSDRPYTHKDQQNISTISAILPFMNEEYPFVLRQGFDAGVLRRCAVRPLHLPANSPGATVHYIDDDGKPQETVVPQEAVVGDEPHNLTGMETHAVTETGNSVKQWW